MVGTSCCVSRAEWRKILGGRLQRRRIDDETNEKWMIQWRAVLVGSGAECTGSRQGGLVG